jgi:hypothetical protein
VKPELEDLVRVARRELRKTSGVPLTEEERAEEVKAAEMEAMMPAMLRLGIQAANQLRGDLVWRNGSASAEFNVDGRIFYMSKAGDAFTLSRVEGDSERELVRIDAKDTQFANRLLDTVGDACQAS